MALAQYQITHRKTENGNPLSVMTIRLEYEILIGLQGLDTLRDVVTENFNRGVEVSEPLDEGSYSFWLEELDRINQLRNSIDGVKPIVLYNLASEWSPIPKRGLAEIMRSYALSTEQKLTVYISGNVPKCEIAINWGGLTVKVPISRSELETAASELSELANVLQVSADNKESKEKVKETLNAVVKGGAIASGIGKCVYTIGVAAEVGLATEGLGLALFVVSLAKSCGGAIAGIVGLYNAADERAATERAATERAAAEREAAVENAMHAREPKDIDRRIDISNGLDDADKISRTC